MIYADLATVFAILVQNLTLSFLTLLAGRLILGLVVGINSVVIPKYIYSVSPVFMAGSVGSLHQLFTLVGVTIGFAMSFAVTGTGQAWRVLLGLPAITCLGRMYLLNYAYTYDIPAHRLKDAIVRKLEDYYYRVLQYNADEDD